MVNVTSGSLKDYFTIEGNSSSFICGIPDSCGIEGGKVQVYAIPEGTAFSVSDPASNGSTILITRVENESGQLVGYGYLFNATATQNLLNFTVTPSDSGLLINAGAEGLNASITFCYANSGNYSAFQYSNVAIDALETANFTVMNWQTLNNTSPSPVTLVVVPEFPTSMALPFFVTATLLAALILRRKRVHAHKSVKSHEESAKSILA